MSVVASASTSATARQTPGRTGEPVELARYTLTDGTERILCGRGVHGEALLLDMPSGDDGRVYLVERDLDLDGNHALQALIADYLARTAELGGLPHRHGMRRSSPPWLAAEQPERNDEHQFEEHDVKSHLEPPVVGSARRVRTGDLFGADRLHFDLAGRCATHGPISNVRLWAGELLWQPPERLARASADPRCVGHAPLRATDRPFDATNLAVINAVHLRAYAAGWGSALSCGPS